MGEVTFLSRGAVDKAPTGIAGLDEITLGGLPRKRGTLVCGGPGTGKTLLGLQFLLRGALDHDEPGVLFSFERSADDLTADAASVGWDLEDLDERDLIAIDPLTPDLDPEGDRAWSLTERVETLDAVGARRVLLDSSEAMFRLVRDPAALRREEAVYSYARAGLPLTSRPASIDTA